MIVVLCNPIGGSAHPMPGTTVLLDVGEGVIDAELLIPAGNLAEASGIAVDVRTELSAEDSEGLVRYVGEHLRVASAEGVPWEVEIRDVRVDFAESAVGGYKEVVVLAGLTPPAGGDMRRLVLGYDVVMREVVTHVAVVSVRQDWGAGQVEGDDSARQVGVVRVDGETMTVPPLAVDLDEASVWRGFAGMVVLGGHHILEGTDHLLFLFTLLLPAVLIARNGRWYADSRWRRAVRHILAVTVAFTVGHSVALVVSALTRIEIPASPVETLIALTILVGGAHAIRPLFPGREALVAGVFGLIHGMAFSFTLAELKLSTGQLALSVLGFNLGIEIVQLLLVALALPPLLVLATTRAQPVLRVGGSAVVIVAALGWALDRLGFANPIARAADQIGTSILPIVAGAGVLAVVVLALRGRARVGGESHSEVWEFGEEAGGGGGLRGVPDRAVARRGRDGGGLSRAGSGSAAVRGSEAAE
ncbi:HupE/UreJ family protein [Nocardia sp. 2]|uniref:HupE/UreJ family protein n=1 Tax=Nocardia acididurans TaxID=2802282 RepID=A0ABS1M1K2_9NOCA|nr:HupE/UreJ family protein [Nocardia acididurans]MBL1074089.1 HupE/UreJ family protein [Nocardia acididurans]